jgi:hypothetical protein
VNLPVEFVIRRADLHDVTKQLQANRGEHDNDPVDILVSGNLAIFRCVGTEAEASVDGKHPGSARIPLRIVGEVDEAVKTFKTKELPFLCEPGRIKVGSMSVKHAEIKVGRASNRCLELPVDLSLLDTLALAEIFDSDKILEEGLRPRVEKARDTRTHAINAARANLEAFGVTERQLQGLIDAHVKNAAEKLRPSLKIP